MKQPKRRYAVALTIELADLRAAHAAHLQRANDAEQTTPAAAEELRERAAVIAQRATVLAAQLDRYHRTGRIGAPRE